jgi:hypothetical protein
MRNLIALFAVFVFLACARHSAPSPAPSAGDASFERSPDEVRALYAGESETQPLAQKLCEALHIAPERSRAACCGVAPAITFAAECTRTLSAAIRARAVTVEADRIDRCISAYERRIAGCEWVGPSPPVLPEECQGLITGALAEGATCRSSLECVHGLRCQGLGPTDPGRCAQPGVQGSNCGSAVDPLAVHTRQKLEPGHPTCSGYCYRTRCAPEVDQGETCQYQDACGPNRHCGDGKCRAGKTASLGQACTLGGCQYPARCMEGICSLPKAVGLACRADAECQGGCVRGVCAMRCDVR